MLPVVWTIFAVCAVGGFITLAAYWLDVQDRTDLSFRRRVVWSLAIFLFPFYTMVPTGVEISRDSPSRPLRLEPSP